MGDKVDMRYRKMPIAATGEFTMSSVISNQRDGVYFPLVHRITEPDREVVLKPQVLPDENEEFGGLALIRDQSEVTTFMAVFFSVVARGAFPSDFLGQTNELLDLFFSQHD